MTGFLFLLHGLISLLLIVVILMQSGRGGGLTEMFSSGESMFGAKTNEFMVKVTTAFCVLFFVTSLALAYLSAQKGRSLLSGVEIDQPEDVKNPLEEVLDDAQSDMDEILNPDLSSQSSSEGLGQDAPVGEAFLKNLQKLSEQTKKNAAEGMENMKDGSKELLEKAADMMKDGTEELEDEVEEMKKETTSQ